MSKLKIGVVVGSTSQQSINRRLAQGLVRLVPDQADFEFLDIGHLPVYNRDFDGTPAAKPFEELKSRIRSCQGMLFVTPEHNRSVPAALKNALDGGSRPYGQSAWSGIPAAVIGSSPGGAGTAMAQQHLRNIFVFLDMPTMQQPEGFVQWKEGLIDADGNIGPASHDFLTKYMSRFLDWVSLHQRA
ncbi:NADPH-dependent FMN reductase [Comamonas guangdongensis]|uniref:NADPH-dependent FMN reductase n=1 Tax=Comamonas guangdongensis TaxID=510515 RepID=A0ABV4A010_9BURK